MRSLGSSQKSHLLFEYPLCIKTNKTAVFLRFFLCLNSLQKMYMYIVRKSKTVSSIDILYVQKGLMGKKGSQFGNKALN